MTHFHRKSGPTLPAFIEHSGSSLPALRTADGAMSCKAPPGSPPLSASSKSMTPRLFSKRLNPYFGEWLMGWRIGWTSATVCPASSASETESWRRRLDAQLSCLLGEPDSFND